MEIHQTARNQQFFNMKNDFICPLPSKSHLHGHLCDNFLRCWFSQLLLDATTNNLSRSQRRCKLLDISQDSHHRENYSIKNTNSTFRSLLRSLSLYYLGERMHIQIMNMVAQIVESVISRVLSIHQFLICL